MDLASSPLNGFCPDPDSGWSGLWLIRTRADPDSGWSGLGCDTRCVARRVDRINVSGAKTSSVEMTEKMSQIWHSDVSGISERWRMVSGDSRPALGYCHCRSLFICYRHCRSLFIWRRHLLIKVDRNQAVPGIKLRLGFRTLGLGYIWFRLGFRWELGLVLHYFLGNYFHSVHFNAETARSIFTDFIYSYTWAQNYMNS